MPPITAELDPIQQHRTRPAQRGRRQADRDIGGGEAWGGAGMHEYLSMQLTLRHRLTDDVPCSAELTSHGLHPRGGQLPPALLDPQGQVLRDIVRVSRSWDEGPVATLIQAADLAQGGLIGHVATALTRSGWQADRLELILPEQALIDLDDDAILSLAALRDLGLGLTLDAFGAGIASMTVMRKVPLTGVKLARAIVRGLPDNREDAAIARAVIGIAQAMGLNVIGDGIETEQQRAFLAHCGCHEGQGPLFGPSIPLQAGTHHNG